MRVTYAAFSGKNLDMIIRIAAHCLNSEHMFNALLADGWDIEELGELMADMNEYFADRGEDVETEDK